MKKELNENEEKLKAEMPDEPANMFRDAQMEKALALKECLSSLNPKNPDMNQLQTITRLNDKQIIVLTNASSISKILTNYGIFNDIPLWTMDFFRQMISQKGQGRKETLEATKYTTEALKNDERRNIMSRLMGRGV